MSDLLYSDTEEALRDSVRHLFADRCPPESVTRAYGPVPQDFSGSWRTLAVELGVAGLLVPQSLGGAGAGAREAAVVMEEIGRAVAPVPFLSSAVLATVALLRAGDTDTVSALAQGELTAALVVPLSTAPGDPVGAASSGADGLSGSVTSVAGAAEADVLVVPVAGPDGLELHTVSRTAAGVEVSPLLVLDMTRPLANVRFSAADSSRVGPADEPVVEALRMGAALLASEQLGVAQWCFETTLDYAKQRKQFGRAIGSYGRRSNTGWRICGSRSAPRRRRPATPPTRAPATTKTPPSRRPSPRRIAAGSPCTRPRSAYSCTAASA